MSKRIRNICHKKSCRIRYKIKPSVVRNVGHRYLEMTEGKPISNEIVVILKSQPDRWVHLDGVWLNFYNAFDSRTDEWRNILRLVVSSDLKYEPMGLFINPEIPPSEDVKPPDHIFKMPPSSTTAINNIVSSPLCSEVEARNANILIAKLSPVYESLPFILGLYNDPAADAIEAQYPRGCYITTIYIWFKDWRIIVNMFRQ